MSRPLLTLENPQTVQHRFCSDDHIFPNFSYGHYKAKQGNGSILNFIGSQNPHHSPQQWIDHLCSTSSKISWLSVDQVLPPPSPHTFRCLYKSQHSLLTKLNPCLFQELHTSNTHFSLKALVFSQHLPRISSPANSQKELNMLHEKSSCIKTRGSYGLIGPLAVKLGRLLPVILELWARFF